MAESLEELIERFRLAGSGEPESWASSEFHEGIAQFARFVFLRELWKLVTPRGSRDWMRWLELPNDDGKGGVKRRLRESTASIDDLTELVHAAQADVVREVAALLDQCAGDGNFEDVYWGLFELDEDDKPVRDIGGLHESINDEDIQTAAGHLI